MEKNRFLDYIMQFKKDLVETEKTIEEDYDFLEGNCGTLAYIGLNYSFELANIGFELGYSNWVFDIRGDFENNKKEFNSLIIENEKIEKLFNDKELEIISKRILNCKENMA